MALDSLVFGCKNSTANEMTNRLVRELRCTRLYATRGEDVILKRKRKRKKRRKRKKGKKRSRKRERESNSLQKELKAT